MRIIFSLCFLLFVHLLCAQHITGLDPNKRITQYHLETWNVDQGTPSNTAQAVLCSQVGYMWFATYDGLVRFDGVRFEIIEKGLNGRNMSGVISLFEDSKGVIWVGTNGDGLLKYVDDDLEIYPVDSVLQSVVIVDMAETLDGNLWLATKKGIVQFSKGKFYNELALKRLQSMSISAIEQASDGTLWIGTEEGLFKFKDGQLTRIGKKDGLSSNFVRSLFMDTSGTLWVGTDYGLNKIEKNVVKRVLLNDLFDKSFVNAIDEDQNGTIWIGLDEGLVKLIGNKVETLNSGLLDNTIQCVTIDNEGSLWGGTYRGGVFRLKESKFVNFGKSEGFNSDVVNVAIANKKDIWVGTDAGLVLIDSLGEVYPMATGYGYSQNRVRDIFFDNEGRQWVATYGGLIEIKDRKIANRISEANGLSNNSVRVLLEDNDKGLWIGTAKGLNILRNGKLTSIGLDQGLHNEFIMSIFKDSKGQMWVGTDGGGLHLFEDGKIVHFGLQDGLPSQVIFRISEDKNGLLWICSNSGLSIFDGSTFKTITRSKGLYSNTLFQVLFDGNNGVWMTTNKGLQFAKYDDLLTVFEAKEAELKESSIYNSAEGMRSSMITAASKSSYTLDHRLLIPTIGGLTIIEPGAISINKVAPPVKITAVRVNNIDIDFLKEGVIIPPGKHSLDIDYTGLSLYAPKEVKFKFMLTGFHKDWVSVGTRRTAYFTNIPPGEYKFKVIAANNDGIWNETGEEIVIQKQAYFYQKIWFAPVLFIIMILAGFSFYRVRVTILKNRNEYLSNLVESRTQHITEQKQELESLNHVKDKLISIISHDLRSPLNTLTGMLQLFNSGNLTHEEIQVLTTKLADEISKVRNMLDNLLNWARSQMKGLKVAPKVLEMSALVAENFGLLWPDAERKGIKLVNEVYSDKQAFADEEMIKLVIRNLLLNAIKFTENGEITVRAYEEASRIEIEVADTGVGISESNKKKLFSPSEHFSSMGTLNEAGTGLGLLICKEFLELNGGKIWVSGQEGEGARFIFSLPKPS